MSREEKFLIGFDYSNLVGISSNSDDPEDDFDVDDHIVSNLSNPNGLVAMFTLSKICRIL